MRLSFRKVLMFEVLAVCLALHGHAFAASIPYECDLGGNSSDGMSNCPHSSDSFGSDTVRDPLPTSVDTDNSQSLNCSMANTYCGARLSGKAVAPINAWGRCAWLDNTGSDMLFIPFKTSDEWSSFLSAASSMPNIRVISCVAPSSQSWTTVTPPYAQCTSANIQMPPVYGRYNSSTWHVPQNTNQGQPPQIIPSAPTFTCHSSATTVQSFLQYKAGNPADAGGPTQYNWTPDFYFSPDLTLTAVDATNANNAGATIVINSGSSAIINWYSALDPNTGFSPQNWSCTPTDTLSAGWPGDPWARMTFDPATATYAGNQWITSTYPSSTNPHQPSTTGSVAFAPPGSGTYVLTCTNTANSTSLTSSTSVTINVNGVCGGSSGQTFTASPSTNLCYGNDTSSAVATNANNYAWSCTPQDGGTSENCYANRCTPNWQTANIGACSLSCGGGTQDVYQTDGCGNTRTLTQSCNTQSCCVPNWQITNYSSCSASCGGGTQTVTQSDGCGSTSSYQQACNTQACAPVPPCGDAANVQSVSSGGLITCRGNSTDAYSASNMVLTGACGGGGCNCGSGSFDWRCKGKTWPQVCNNGSICPITFTYRGFSFSTNTQCKSRGQPQSTSATLCSW